MLDFITEILKIAAMVVGIIVALGIGVGIIDFGKFLGKHFAEGYRRGAAERDEAERIERERETV